MAIAFVAASAPVSFAAATEAPITRPAGTIDGELLVCLFAFEGVAAGSGPWTNPNNDGSQGSSYMGTATGWRRVCWQAPSATGCGLEVWVADEGAPGSTAHMKFAAVSTGVIVQAAWSGQYDSGSGGGGNGAVRAAVTAQVAGDDPACPDVYAYATELVIAVGADKLASPGFGTPTPAGWTTRTDAARGGVYGNVEAVIADMTAAVEGDTGSIPFAASASSGGIGATGTIAVRPVAIAPPATSPVIAVEYA